MSQPRDGHVLVVCTGNVCRSPYLERALAHSLADTDIVVSSAGTGALAGYPMVDESASRVRSLGADPEGFLARQIAKEIINDSDLVITATREHLDQVVQVSPRALRYGLALADLADLVAGLDIATFDNARGTTHVARVAAVAVSRRAAVRPRLPEQAAIIDPFRQSAAVFDQMVSQIDDHLPTVVRALRG